jgi:hypothetical protein
MAPECAMNGRASSAATTWWVFVGCTSRFFSEIQNLLIQRRMNMTLEQDPFTSTQIVERQLLSLGQIILCGHRDEEGGFAD